MASHLAPRERAGARRAAGVVRAVVGVAVFLAGAALFMWPTVEASVSQEEADAVIREAAAENEAVASEDSAAYEYLRAYNERVRSGELVVNDPWGIGSDAEELASVGLADGVVGSLTVPSMDVHLPIYLGSTHENLERGATLMAGTSAPLGEESSNVVLAGHRGYLTNGLFRNIESVQVGDLLQIETPWDTLVYRAVEILVVDPDDVDSVRVQEGRDLVTLLTCHPYGTTERRYLVVFERTTDPADLAAFSEEEATADTVLPVVDAVTEALEPSESPALVVERWARVAGLAIMVALPVWAVAHAVRGTLRRRRAG